MVVRMNGKVISQKPSVETVEGAKKEFHSHNRKARRSKKGKWLASIIGVLSALGISKTAHASDGIVSNLSDSIIDSLTNKLADGLGMAPYGVPREDTLAWQLNELMTNTILTTQNFFGTAQIVNTFSIVWYITMSFTMILITKKGFDKMKSAALGQSTIGIRELIIRLVASLVMTFLALDIFQLGIQLSNGLVGLLFGKFSAQLIPYEEFRDFDIGSIIWFFSYVVMFTVLGIRYWMRQIVIILMGVLSPVANLAWTVDGGAMQKALIREASISLVTPVIHGLILMIGTTIIFGLNNMVPFSMGINQILIGLSTMCLMIFTPEFLRKFINGSANPLRSFVDIAKGIKAMPGQMSKLMKGAK